MNDIVPVGKLAAFEDFNINGLFEDLNDADTAKEYVSKVEKLKKMLDVAEQYGQYASQFCEGEARLYVKIAEIEGAEAKLTASKRRMVEWVREKSAEELETILHECMEGTRIGVIFRRETQHRHKYDPVADCERVSNAIVKQATTRGHTTLTKASFYEMCQKPELMPSSAVSAFVEKTRDKLLKNNALGLGDGNGTYVLLEKCDRNEVAQMVKTRLESIVADLKTIKTICQTTGFIVPREGTQIICNLVDSLNDDTDSIDLDI